MATKKYEHLIKPLSVGKLKGASAGKPQDPRAAFTVGPGGATQKVWLSGRDHLEGMNLNFTFGLYKGLGDWFSGQSLHTHPYPECHMFVGLDTANVNYLGAEIEVRLGEEQQGYTFNEPTVVVIPAGLPHGPIVTKRMFSPKGFASYLVALSSAPKMSWVDKPAKAAKSTGKYSHLVKSLKPFTLTERGKFNPNRFTAEELAKRQEQGKKSKLLLGPGNSDHLTWMFGNQDLEGLDVNMDWGFFSNPGLWHRGVGAHVHSVDEVLVYVGTNPQDIDDLGAEIEMDMGKEHERYLINKPSVVVLPAGTAHAPIVTRWADRPFAFYSVNLASESVMKFID